jgi:phosphoesterase RecJ-like protein
MGLALMSVGKHADIVSLDGVPSNFHHLEGSQLIQRAPKGDYDTICVLDCSDLQRTGELLDDFGRPDLNIDHHVTNLNFAQVNLVDTGAVATTEILAKIFPDLGLPMTKPIAEALLTGLITDTIGFRTANMTPQALRLAADLMENELDLSDLYRRALVSRTLEELKLWGVGLSKVKCTDNLAWTTITLTDRQRIGYSGLDDADLVNVLRSIDTVDVAIIFLEQPGGRVKISWRSKPSYDISQIALSFGGGGHANASGAEVEGELEEVRNAVLEATRTLFVDRVSVSDNGR